MTPSATQHDPWPFCPECEAVRQTTCPVCQTPSVDFTVADRSPEAAPTRSVHGDKPDHPLEISLLRLRCNICDELFTPVFYDHCHQCGYEFDDGVASKWVEPDEVTTRMVFVAAALVGLFLAAIVYFGWLL